MVVVALRGVCRSGVLTFCTFYWLGRWLWSPSRAPESPRSTGGRQQGLLLIPHKYTLFLGGQKRAKMADFDGFLDLNRLLDGVMGSNLIQNGRTTSLVHVKVMVLVHGTYFTIKSLLGCPESQDLEPKWSFFGFLRPLEASRGKII